MWQAVFAGAALAAALIAPASALASPKVGDAVSLPDVRLMDGRTLSAESLRGKPLIIEYWASWCPFCARQNPYLEKLSQSAREKGLQVLAVSIDRKEEDAAAYLRKHQYTFDAAMESPALREVFGKRKVIPEIFVIREDGRIAEIIPGEMFEEDVLDLIKYAPSAASPR